MPKVHKQKARKDYPKFGIKKGDTYYKWSILLSRSPYRSANYMSLSYPRRSQLTRSEFYSWLWDFEDEIKNSIASDEADLENLRGEWVGVLEEQRDELQGRMDNMPEQFQGTSDAYMTLEERVSGLEDWISNLENVDITVPDDEDFREDAISALDEIHEENDEPLPADGHSEEDVQAKIEELRQEKIDELLQELIDANPGLG